MALDFTGNSAPDLVDAKVDTAPEARSSVCCPLTSELATLGPVLMVSEADGAHPRPWRFGVTIDGDGVREWVDVGPCRLYRLPDSDYLAWERLSGVHGSRPGAQIRDNASTLRRAIVVVAFAGQWRRVLRLSACGWEQARNIARLERATLIDGAVSLFTGFTAHRTRGA